MAFRQDLEYRRNEREDHWQVLAQVSEGNEVFCLAYSWFFGPIVCALSGGPGRRHLFVYGEKNVSR